MIRSIVGTKTPPAAGRRVAWAGAMAGWAAVKAGAVMESKK